MALKYDRCSQFTVDVMELKVKAMFFNITFFPQSNQLGTVYI